MKHRPIILLWLLLILGACTRLSEGVYEETLLDLKVQAIYPEGYADYCREGVVISAEEITSKARYTATTDPAGCAHFRLCRGFYRIAISDRSEEAIFNAMSDQINLTSENLTLSLPLTFSRPGTILIREIYCGGCSKAPQEGYYQSDRYFILHNNNSEVEYLDGLMFGTLEPYNSNASSGNAWISTDPESGATIFREYAPVVEAIWRLPGKGQEYPLQPGEGAVVVINGAIDHTTQYPHSVNLNNESYFVCYNPTLYPNVEYHPAPGDQISPSRYCEVAIKVGKSTGYIISINSPTLILFRAPESVDMDAYLNNRSESTVTKPGSSEICVKIPWEWVIDGVEIYNGSASNNHKRLPDSVDAGFVSFSAPRLGHTLHRQIDPEASAEAGYSIYCDTNNSSVDFYEREEQSLKSL